MLKVFVVVFMLCTGGGREGEESCAEGEVWAASCVAGEAHIREGLREGVELWVLGCEEH
jgi:hypothetical protein